MKPGIPWSVKGIDGGAREAAKHAARRSGLTLGEWLNTVIREQAAEVEPEKRPAPPGATLDIESRLDHLSDLISRLARSPVRQPPPAEIMTPAGSSERRETPGSKFAEGLGSFLREPQDMPAYRALETAVRSIVDHIELSERKTRDALKALESRFSDVDSDHLLANAPVIARIENRIADLTGRANEKEEGIRKDLRKLVHSEFGRLAARIASVKLASENAAQRAQAHAVQLARSDLRQLESRMEEQLRAAQAASEHDLRSLRAVIEQLSARIAQESDPGRGVQVGNRIAQLEQRVFELDERIAQAMGEHRASTLEQSIRQLLHSMEQNRVWTREVAEEAASRTASRLMQDRPAEAPDAPPSPNLPALEKALETVTANYEAADRRNQETLGAVRATLDEIIGRLTALERLRGATASARQARTGVADGAPESAPSVQDDFIAAARRAAQAAAQLTPGPPAADVEAASTAAAAAEMKGKRRRLILVAIVLLMAVSALAYTGIIRLPEGAPLAPSPLEQMIP